ncbi:hypothetical protein evm_012970 [Chilo suppressalis]|nr:hypothetical protein evm_012970 [Chilo suppressalis]
MSCKPYNYHSIVLETKMAAQKVFIIASAFLVQAVFGQSYVSGNTLVENFVVGNQGLNNINVANTGINSIGIANTGINSIGLANAGLNSIGLANTGLNSIGLANTGISSIGVANAGLSNVGLIGAGLGGVGVIGGGTTVGTVGAGLNGVAFNVGGLNVGSSGPLAVTTISPIGPSGLAVASENLIDGTLLVSGSLPFLSAVSFEGALPTAGSGVATCGCGNGTVGIISDGFPAVTPVPSYGIGTGYSGIYF